MLGRPNDYQAHAAHRERTARGFLSFFVLTLFLTLVVSAAYYTFTSSDLAIASTLTSVSDSTARVLSMQGGAIKPASQYWQGVFINASTPLSKKVIHWPKTWVIYAGNNFPVYDQYYKIHTTGHSRWSPYALTGLIGHDSLPLDALELQFSEEYQTEIEDASREGRVATITTFFSTESIAKTGSIAKPGSIANSGYFIFSDRAQAQDYSSRVNTYGLRNSTGTTHFKDVSGTGSVVSGTGSVVSGTGSNLGRLRLDTPRHDTTGLHLGEPIQNQDALVALGFSDNTASKQQFQDHKLWWIQNEQKRDRVEGYFVFDQTDEAKKYFESYANTTSF